MKKLMEGWREYERKVLTEELTDEQRVDAKIRHDRNKDKADALDPDKRKWWQKLLGIDKPLPLNLDTGAGGPMEIEGKPPLIGGSMDPDFDWRDSPVIVGHTQIDPDTLSGEEFTTRYGFTRAEAGHDAVQGRLDYLDAHPDVWDETME
jgi:hypothetical protein